MSIVLNGTTGITTPDVSVTAQSSDIVTSGNIEAVNATLSGGVYVGGTGSANYLDDYEEGTWTPSSITGSNLTSISWSTGYYTKVGRLVTVVGYVNCTVTSSNTLTYLTMTGAPFTTGLNTVGSSFLNNNVRSGTSQIAGSLLYSFFSAASAPVSGSEVIQFSITYTV